MCADGKNNIADIEESFKNKKSNKFYEFYYKNEKNKELINSWIQLRNFYYEKFPEKEASNWIFRGDIAERNNEHSMKEAFRTSLDKAFEEFDPPKETKRNKIEEAIIRAFRRRAHHFTDDKNIAQNQLDALGLLRHHGGPARILDWMYSFFPAVYLAMNKEYNKKDNEPSTYTVWALNKRWLNYESKLFENDHFLKDEKYLKEHSLKSEKLRYYQNYDNNLFQKFVVTYIINQNPKSLIYAATPYHLNERLAAQRATLLFAGTVDKTWGENLQDMIKDSLKRWPLKDKNNKEIKGVNPILCEIPFTLTKEERKYFLRGLDEMNINQVTLFPDLDGFAESLRTRIAHPESLGLEFADDE